jgi:hypothetical protein
LRLQTGFEPLDLFLLVQAGDASVYRTEASQFIRCELTPQPVTSNGSPTAKERVVAMVKLLND